MKLNRSHRTPIARVVSAVLASAASFAPLLAHAEDTTGLEEVIVTATRHGETNLQKTPIAVTAISREDLVRMAGKDLSGIATEVPNFSASHITAFNAASFAIRGIGLTDIIVYLDSPVAVNIDDFVTPSVQTQLLDTFDIENVEVLRGPQGTLFGKNTTGGLVNVTTKRPKLDETSAEFRALYGSFGHYQIQGALNVPMGDTFAMRGSVSYNKSDGYYKNGATYGPTVAFDPAFAGLEGKGNGDSVGGDDIINGRIKALWQPSDDFKALFQYEFVRDRSDAVPSFNDTPKEPGCDPFGLGFIPDAPACVFVWNSIGVTSPSGDPIKHMATTNRNDGFMATKRGQKVDVDGLYANLDWNLGFGTLHGVFGARSQDSRLPNTYTGAVPVLEDGTEVSLFDASRDDNRDTYQAEIRLASNGDGAVDWVVGAFWQQNDAEFCVAQMLGINAFFGLGASNNEEPSILCNKQDATSYAGFVDVTWQATEKLQVGAGFRETYDKRDWTGRPQGTVAQITGDPLATWRDFSEPLDLNNFTRSDWAGNAPCDRSDPGNITGVCKEGESWTEPTYGARIAYQWTDDINSYLRYDHGFKSGGYNDQTGTGGFFVAPLLKAYDPEFADSYELGLKTTMLENRLRFNAALFYVKYTDMQRSVVTQLCIPDPQGPITCASGESGRPFQATAFFNAADVTDKGVELEATALVFDGFIVKANYAYNDGTYNKFATDSNGDGTNDVDLSGRPLTRTPKNKWAINGLYTHDAFGGSMAYNLVYSHEDKNVFYYSDISPAFNSYLDERNLLDASVTYTAEDGKWFVRAFGNNLTDERYRIASQVVGALWTHSQFGAPRNYGVQFGTNFNW